MSRKEETLGWMYFAFQMLALPMVLSWVDSRLSVPMSRAVYNGSYYIVNFAALTCIFRRFLRASLVALGRNVWNFLRAAVPGFAAYWVCSRAYEWALSLLGLSLNNANDGAIVSMLQSHPILMGICIIGLVPLTEELIYRGLIFGNLRQVSRLTAYLVSMIAFSAIHVAGYIGATDPLTLLLCFIQYLPAGLCLAWTYDRSHNLFAPVLVHTIVNAIAVGLVR